MGFVVSTKDAFIIYGGLEQMAIRTQLVGFNKGRFHYLRRPWQKSLTAILF